MGFTGLGFFFMRKVIQPHAGRNLDFDALYRLVGKALTALFTKPLAAVDNVWTNVYRQVGLRIMMATAGAASVFDRKGIDAVVDGTASNVRKIGWFSSRLQTGRLQDYLAWTIITALLLFAVVWAVADMG